MKKILLAFIVAIFALTACGKGVDSQYIGKWKISNRDFPSAIEISKNGDNYLIVLTEYDGIGRLEPRSMSASLKDGILYIGDGIMAATITYIEKDGTLIVPKAGEFAGGTYKRAE